MDRILAFMYKKDPLYGEEEGRGELRVVKVADSPDCPEAEAEYMIGDGGIMDSNE